MFGYFGPFFGPHSLRAANGAQKVGLHLFIQLMETQQFDLHSLRAANDDLKPWSPFVVPPSPLIIAQKNEIDRKTINGSENTDMYA